MRTLSIIYLGLAALAFGPGAPARAPRPPQDEPPDAARLLDAADAKIATPEARKKLARLQASGTMEAMGMKCTVEERHLGADRACMNVRFPGFAPMTMGIEPRFAWSTDPAMGILTVAGAEAGPMRRLMGFARRAPWRELYASAKTVGSEEIEKQACWKLELTSADGAHEYLFLRKDDGLPLCFDTALPDFQEGTIAVRFLYAEWKAVDGILFPHERRQVVGSYDLRTKFAKFELGAEFDDKLVAPPDDVVQHWNEKGSQRRPSALPAGECRIEEIGERHALSVRLEIDEKDIAKTLAVVLGEVSHLLAERGGSSDGPPYSRYHKRENGKVDIEAGIPVRKAMEGKDRVKPVVFPAGPAAVTWHHGPYHELVKSYAVLELWMKEQKLRSRGPVYEIYWTDPGLEPDPQKWRTQIIWPVEK